jgi:hypothetical protein
VCSAGLTYNVTTQYSNYSYVVRLSFSNNITVNGNISDILNFKVSGTRLLQVYYTSTGIPFTLREVSNGIYEAVFDTKETGLTNLNF